MPRLFIISVLMILSISGVSAAHFIIGVVNNSIDGDSPNGMNIVLWNPINGQDKNVSDVIGEGGNSGTSNFYMIDCELLDSPCNVGDNLFLKVSNSLGFTSSYASVTVSGAGYDLANDLILNSPPKFLNITVDDEYNIPNGEIDLNAGSTKKISCEGVIKDSEGDDIIYANATFFHNVDSSYTDLNDNNKHYTNSSCYFDSNYGENMTYVQCLLDIWYYANSGQWNCTMEVRSDMNVSIYGSNISSINKLLALSLPDSLDYGIISGLDVSNESEINISNYGNTMINISLEGYGISQGDGLAMHCTGGVEPDIPITNQKYNLTQSNAGEINFDEFNSLYLNLTSESVIRKLNLGYRQDDFEDNAIMPTYWRIYVPSGVLGNCSGNIIFGARLSAGS